MLEKSVAFITDGSEYARALARELADEGTDVRLFERSEELEWLLDDSSVGVIIVSPHLHQARSVRNAMNKAGGWASKIPLIAAVKDAEQLTETETLKHFDDFLVVPGHAAELLARLTLVIARRGGKGNVISHGDLLINLDAHQVTIANKPVDLTYKEYELLKMLASTPGRAYTREELLKNVWGYDYFGGTRTVDVHVRRLRSKIESNRSYIDTVHGIGYRFSAT